jgi:hypothetical protein
MQMPFSTGSSFLVFRIFVAFWLSIMGLSMAFRGDAGGALFLGSVLAAVGLTFLTVMWLIVRGSAAG